MLRRLVILIPILVFMLVAQGCISIPLPSPPRLREVVVEPGSAIAAKKIAIVDVSGIISATGTDGFWSADSSVVDLAKKLGTLKEDPSVKAVILRIDSPGGGVTASDIMYNDVKRFKAETKIPVYVSMQSLCASGGYYISMAADQIYAHSTTVTGSIGVITAFPDVSELMDTVGVKMNAITSGPQKDNGAFYKSMSPETRAIFQSMVDDMYNRFVSIVAENRTALGEPRVRELADGRVYTANQAYENGLIDGIADLHEVIEKVKTDLNLKKPRVVVLTHASAGTSETPYVMKNEAPGTTQINMININASPSEWLAPKGEVMHYLFVP